MIADFPEGLNELFASLVGCQLQKGIAFVFGDNVSDVPFQPVAIVLFQFLLFLGKTDSAACEETRRKQHDRPARDKAAGARAAHPRVAPATSVAVRPFDTR